MLVPKYPYILTKAYALNQADEDTVDDELEMLLEGEGISKLRVIDAIVPLDGSVVYEAFANDVGVYVTLVNNNTEMWIPGSLNDFIDQHYSRL
jgi:hypothetical protein